MNTFRIGYFQFRPIFGRMERNVKIVVSALANVRADLIVLPELAFTGYYFRDRKEVFELADDPRKSAVVEALTALCRQRRTHVVTGFAERRKDRCFNSALLIGPSGLMHVYRKMHLFNEEKQWFDPGDTPLDVHRIRGVRVGIMICFDWIFPEAARTLALRGAHVIAHPSNLVLNYCQQAMLTRSLENGVFTVTANRTGVERRPHGELKFTGQSQITAPRGQLLHRAPRVRQSLHVETIHPEMAEDKYITARNHLFRDRRDDRYV